MLKNQSGSEQRDPYQLLSHSKRWFMLHLTLREAQFMWLLFCFTGISNCEFHSGKAEAVLPQLLASWEDGRPLVAVVNPSRAGLRERKCYLFSSCKLRVLNKFCETCYTGSKPFPCLVSCFLLLRAAKIPLSLLFSVPSSCFLFISDPFSIFHRLTQLFKGEGTSGVLWCNLPNIARPTSELYEVI